MKSSHPTSNKDQSAVLSLIKDPVCQMDVVPDKTKASSTFQGEIFYFCSQKCKIKFDENPPSYIKKSHPNSPAKTSLGYTCPMHPQVRRMTPGSCPICAMACEPVMPSSDAENSPEYVDMKRRFWLSAVLSFLLMLLTMGPFMRTHSPYHKWIEFSLATPTVFWCGWPFLVHFWNSLRQQKLNMFTLIGCGVLVAFLYSLVAIFFPSLFPASLRDPMSAEVPLYFEAASMIITFVLLGQVLEIKARSQTSAALKSLLTLYPKTARKINQDGSESEVLLDHVTVGDQIKVRPGEKVPTDGIVVLGESNIDESMITGESIPVEKKPGSKVLGATINGTGSFIFNVEKTGSDTMLSQIIQMVTQAQSSRAPIQKIADQVSAFFVPLVILIAIFTAMIWMAAGPEPKMAHALVSAVAVLIIACPCALGLATPISIMVATGRAATLGILFKNAEAIEQLRKIDTLVIDKTGTLTVGKPQLTNVKSAGILSDFDLLSLAASLENSSEHPLALAIVNGAKDRKVSLKNVSHFYAHTGKGITAEIDGKSVAIGNKALMTELNVDFSAYNQQMDELREEGQTIMLVSAERRFVGFLAVSDPIKDSAISTIQELKNFGIKVIMLTGDHTKTAASVAKKVGIEDFFADVLPKQKADVVKELQLQGKIVAMTGDGINDAPALAQAHVGIAMGTGTDVAMNTAGLTLVKGDLKGILRAKKLSEKTMLNIKQNLFFAFVYNSLSVPLAAGLLYPHFGILLSPMIAAIVMSLSSISVVINALRLKTTAL